MSFRGVEGNMIEVLNPLTSISHRFPWLKKVLVER